MDKMCNFEKKIVYSALLPATNVCGVFSVSELLAENFREILVHNINLTVCNVYVLPFLCRSSRGALRMKQAGAC